MPETAAPATASGQAPPAHAGAPMNDRALRLTMTALLMGLFVAMLSNLVVLTAMPRIAADLHATQAHYTWIITSSMLTIAVCTPIWGRMADLFDKKRMMQACVGGYVTCSVFASLAQAPWQIIVARVGIGVCAAGIIILLQTISASIMSARRQAEWLGYRAAVLSVATMGAPSLGGLVTQHLGWRACFVVGVPFAVASILMLEKTLHLPRRPAQPVSVDWPGALLLAGGIVAMMLWVSVLGPGRGFLEPLSLAVAGLGALLLLATVMVEQRVSAPVLPLPLLGNRVVALCVLAAAGAGIGMFCSAVFLAPYLQIGRGLGPAVAGLMALPEAGASLCASVLTGRVISRHGHVRPTLVVGALVLLAGLGLLSTLRQETPFVLVGCYIALAGAGLGVIGETLTIVVQNAVPRGQIGAAGALVAFGRMAGGIGGVTVLGAALAASVGHRLAGVHMAGFDAHALPALARLAPPLRALVQAAYAQGVAHVYLLTVPVGLVVLGAMLALPAHRLSDEHPQG